MEFYFLQLWRRAEGALAPSRPSPKRKEKKQSVRKQKIEFFLLLILSTVSLYSQSTIQSFKKLSPPEKKWAFFHPFIAKKAYHLTIKARDTAKLVAKDTLLDHDENGGQVDAFRHAYWMALLSQKIKPKKAFNLGLAHEKGNYLTFKKGQYEEGVQPDSLAGRMDIYNNAVGVEIGRENKKLNDDELKKFVIKSILSGDMRVLKKDKQGNYLDCGGNIIDLVGYKGKWGIPKCLIQTDINK